MSSLNDHDRHKLEALARYVRETRPLESSDVNEAIQRYENAFERLIRGRIVSGALTGYPLLLDRLTLCYKRTRMWHHLLSVTNEYFNKFPAAADRSIGRMVQRRVVHARAQLDSM